ncbi:hypothetical protein VZ95_13030 [Elstera litoralis]|uniref:Uncharacterized protein n=1 Tax=Elstera litoralis TaxID=552518 RepID=A0A0F3IRL8_9PROT|nr:hypothetical protein [Elstera litoralis]KJV09188.1 hypothetical protein VZ95_13030 [Elstera litoralis]
MTVMVANRLVQNQAALSDIGRLALAFIDGGPEWLSWAISTPTAQYAFADETTLLAQVQQGLHTSRFAFLPTLQAMISPVKLISLGVADLRTLGRAESGDTSAPIQAQIKRIFTDHHLLSGSDFAQGTAFLQTLGVNQAGLFQFLTFEDQLALYQLAAQPSTQTAIPGTEAAQFAVSQARTVLEFADYYQFYLRYCSRMPTASTAQQRGTQATSALMVLLPLLFSALDAPQVPGLVSPAEVANAISVWVRNGRQVGFSRLSEAAAQIAQNTVFQLETGDAARALVQSYIAGAQALIVAQPVRQGILGQDGASCLFPIRSGDQQATLMLGGTGLITLRSYGLQPPSASETLVAGNRLADAPDSDA